MFNVIDGRRADEQMNHLTVSFCILQHQYCHKCAAQIIFKLFNILKTITKTVRTQPHVTNNRQGKEIQTRTFVFFLLAVGGAF